MLGEGTGVSELALWDGSLDLSAMLSVTACRLHVRICPRHGNKLIVCNYCVATIEVRGLKRCATYLPTAYKTSAPPTHSHTISHSAERNYPTVPRAVFPSHYLGFA